MIYNNIITNCSDRGMYIRESKNNTISNNNVYGGGGNSSYRIHLSKTNNSIISNNTIANYKGKGIYMDYSKNNTLFNNTIHEGSGPWSVGIELWYVNNSLFHNNSVYNNNKEGITIFYSYFNAFSNMYIFNNSDGGIYAGESSYLTISNCHIFNNKRSGVLFGNTFHSIITNCVFYSIEHNALSLGSTTQICNNTVFKNDFIADMGYYFEDYYWRSVSFEQINIQGIANNVTHNFYDTHTFPNTDSDEFVDSPIKVGGYPHIAPGIIFDSFPLIAPSNTIFSLHNHTLHYLSRPSLTFPISRDANAPLSIQVVPFRGVETIQWNPSFDSADESITYSLYYQQWTLKDGYKRNNWTTVIEDIMGLSYTFNTTSLPEGRGAFKIGARNAKGMQVNSTYQEIMNDNSKTTVPDQVTPGFSFLVIISMVLVMIPYRRNKR